jgi:hypothetical protein
LTKTTESQARRARWKMRVSVCEGISRTTFRDWPSRMQRSTQRPLTSPYGGFMKQVGLSHGNTQPSWGGYRRTERQSDYPVPCTGRGRYLPKEHGWAPVRTLASALPAWRDSLVFGVWCCRSGGRRLAF